MDTSIVRRHRMRSRQSPRHHRLLELLVEARLLAGLTQVELAKKLQRPQSWVSIVENGERRLDLIEFLELARTLDADPIKLLRKLLQTPES